MTTTGSGTLAAGRVVTQAELAAAATGAVVALLPCTAVLAQGPDAAAFLHGQLANDVTGLPVGGVNQSLSLNHKGHAVAEGSVLRTGKNEVRLALEGEAADRVLAGLREHIIFDQVTLELEPRTARVTLQGASAAKLLPLVPGKGEFASGTLGGAGVLAFARRRSAPGGFDLLVDADDVPVVLAELEHRGALVVDAAVIDALRVRALVPTAAGEGGDGVLPQEAGLEGSLSYRKGCYLGQEIMARIEARGNVRRSLVRLRLAAPVPSGSAVLHGGRSVGRVGSVVSIEGPPGPAPVVEALAVLRSDLPEDAQLEADGVAVCRYGNAG